MPFFKKTAHNRCSVALCAVLVPILTFSLGANLVTLGSRAESYFINLLENAKCRDVLEKEYHFTPNDFYVMNKEE